MAKAKTAAKTTSRDILEMVGIEALCERIVEGASQAELSLQLGVTTAQLSAFLNLPVHEKQFAHARTVSAEAWLDRGLHTLSRALSHQVDPSAAKAYAQECARRAALRNPKYIERTAHEVTGPNGGPVQQVSLTRQEFIDAAKQIVTDV